MTEGSGGHIGTEYVDIRPDARDFARRFREQTGNEADAAGAEFGRRWSRAAQTEMQRNPARARVDADTKDAEARIAVFRQRVERNAANLRVDADTSKAQFQMHLLADSIALVGPAAVPIGAVAVGAIAGLVPTAAAAALGIKGISDELKNGELAGTEYGRDINQLKGELSTLQGIAAGGLLGGLDTALEHSGPLFRTVNTDTANLSAQLGQIVGHAGPGVTALLTDLNPLFSTLGSTLEQGATGFEHWAQSSDSVSEFVAYVQTELPVVEHDLGALLTGIGHLVQGLEPLGDVALGTIGVLSRTLDAIPIGVLSKLETGAIAAYLAFRTYGAITALVAGVNTAVATLGPSQEAAAARTLMANEQVRADEALTAAAFARAESDKAEEAAAAAASIYESLAGTGAALEDEQLEATLEADRFAAAMRVKAEAAAATAEEIAASATAAAEASSAAGEAASLGWSAMLGPIGAVVVGVGLLGTTMLGGSGDTLAAKQATDAYTQALIASNGAINDNIRSQISANLQSAGALDAARELGINTHELVTAIASGGPALADVHAQMDAAAGSVAGLSEKQAAALIDSDKFLQGTVGVDHATQSTTGSIALLSRILGPTRAQFRGAAHDAAEQRAATDGTAVATRRLTTALEALAQARLADAQSQDQFLESVRGVTQQLDKNDGSLSRSTAHGLANRDAFLNSASAALSLKDAQEKAGVSVDRANHHLLSNITDLAQQAEKAGASKSAVHDLLAQLHLLPSEIRTAIDADTTPGEQKVHELQRDINRIRQGKVPGLDASNAAGHQAIVQLQHQIDAIRQHRVPRIDVRDDPALTSLDNLIYKLHQVEGNHTVTVGYVQNGIRHGGNSAAGSASWTPDGKLPPGYSTVGERGWELAGTDSSGRTQIFSHGQSMAMTGLPDRLPGFAGGTSPRVAGIERDAGAVGRATTIDGLLARIHDVHERLANAVDDGLSPKRAKPFENELDKFTSKLKSMQQNLAQVGSSVRSAVAGSFDLGGLTAPDSTTSTAAGIGFGSTVTTTTAGGALTAGSVVGQSSAAVAQVHQFRRHLDKLITEGLNADDVATLASEYPGSIPVVEALLTATPAQIRTQNANEASLKKLGRNLGRDVVGDTFAAGVASGRGIAAGLRSTEPEIEKVMHHIAAMLGNTVRKDLKIHSPSLVFHELGGHVGKGLANGMVASLPAVRDAAGRLSASTLADMRATAGTGGRAAGGGVNVTMPIYPRANQSEREIGRSAGEELAWILRR